MELTERLDRFETSRHSFPERRDRELKSPASTRAMDSQAIRVQSAEEAKVIEVCWHVLAHVKESDAIWKAPAPALYPHRAAILSAVPGLAGTPGLGRRQHSTHAKQLIKRNDKRRSSWSTSQSTGQQQPRVISPAVQMESFQTHKAGLREVLGVVGQGP